MKNSHLTIDVNLAYKSLAFPHKIVIPIEAGKFGIWKYQQHVTDLLSVEKIRIGYADKNRIKIKLRLTGQIDINNFPDLRVGGTKVQVESSLVLETGKLCILHPELTRLDLPNVPNFVDGILRDVLNKNLLKQLKNDLKIDIESILEDTKQQLNQPIPFDINVSAEKSNYSLNLNIEPIETEFAIQSKGIHLKLFSQFKPDIALLPQVIA